MLSAAAYGAAGLGGVFNVLIAVAFARDPAEGMRANNHVLAQLPNVMTGRYLANVFLTAGALILGDLRVIGWLFAAYALMAFADTFIYHRAGLPHGKHTFAGVAATLVALIAVIAHFSNGAA